VRDVVLKAIGDCFGRFGREDLLKLFGLMAIIGCMFLAFLLIATPLLQITIDFINLIWWLLLPIGLVIILFAVYVTRNGD
jgi:hypothetical protein